MLRLSKLTDYAVVILAELAGNKGVLQSAADLAAGTGLPEPTVAKVLKLLAGARLIASERGSTGGYRLERAAAELPIAEIITAMEGPVALTACTEGSHEVCAIHNKCGLRGRWNPVNRAINAALANVTLADMAGR